MNPVSMLSFSIQALKDGTVLRIYREDPHSLFPGQLHNDMSCSNQRLFIRQSDILSRLHGRYGGTNADHAHHSRYYDLSLRFRSRFHQSLHAGNNFHREVCYRCF